MRRLIILGLIAVTLCPTAYGWGRREHAAVAQIAERHLTPKAKKLVTKYLGGRSMVYYSCYADDYQPLYIDLGFEPSNYRRMAMFPHTYCVDENYRPPHSNRDGDLYIKNCLYYIDTWSKELSKSHSTMNDSVRLTHLALIIHAVGDMHCPVHIRYPEDTSLGVYNVTYGKKKMTYHRLWDAGLVGAINPWSYNDLAVLLDTASKREREEIVKGDVFAWGEEAARMGHPARAYKKGAKINREEFLKENLGLGEELIRRAGYRLAKLLNETFK